MPRKKSQNKNSGYKDKLFRIDAELAADLESIAEEQGTSQTTIVHEALKLYRDKRYMSEKASALPSELTETLLAANALLEKKLNAKSNQLLSSMGIELFVIQCILAHILPDQQLKGISILRPITTELIKRENDWVAVRMATNEEREKIAKGELKIYEKTYFAISKVYDISQTDFPKDRYPEIYSMGQKSMDHAEVYACVKELARASGIPVKKEQLPSISLHGYYSPSENAITINSNLEDTKAAVTLCHEYAHGLLHRTSTQSEAICEFEAQSLALMLMARYGLPQDDSEIGYMKTYLERANNDKNFSLDTSLERLQKQLKFVDERISLIAEHRQTEFAQTRAQAREPGKGKQVSENFRVGL